MIIRGSYFSIQKIDLKEIENIYNVYKNCEDFLALGPMATASMKWFQRIFICQKMKVAYIVA